MNRYIYENLIINIPIRILCDEGCKGLCPDCGADLNSNPCSCIRTTESRWDALKSLKNRFPKS
ncbi:MAG: DUF177 domain-containing protein [Candidatus Latescibacterota bacterium]